LVNLASGDECWGAGPERREVERATRFRVVAIIPGVGKLQESRWAGTPHGPERKDDGSVWGRPKFRGPTSDGFALVSRRQ